MAEKELCHHITEAMNKKRINTWYTVKIIAGDKTATFEACWPSRGNLKIRKPFRKSFENKWFYQMYRLTDNMTLFDMGLIEAFKPEKSEVIIYECV